MTPYSSIDNRRIEAKYTGGEFYKWREAPVDTSLEVEVNSIDA